MPPISVDLGLEGTHVIVTGGAGMIGSAVVSAFLSSGAKVSIFDMDSSKLESLEAQLWKDYERYPSPTEFKGHEVDISSEKSIETAFERAINAFGPVQVCVALASLDLSVLQHHESLVDLPLEQWKRTFDVNVHGTFLTARTWLRQLKAAPKGLQNAGLIIVGSESGTFGERGNAAYASGKAAVQGGLLQSLKGDVPRVYQGARVNAIAPGPVDTVQFRKECKENPSQFYLDAQGTVALGGPTSVASVARSIVFLASEAWSGSVHGQILAVDSGKMGKVMWTEEEARSLPRGW